MVTEPATTATGLERRKTGRQPSATNKCDRIMVDRIMEESQAVMSSLSPPHLSSHLFLPTSPIPPLLILSTPLPSLFVPESPAPPLSLPTPPHTLPPHF